MLDTVTHPRPKKAPPRKDASMAADIHRRPGRRKWLKMKTKGNGKYWATTFFHPLRLETVRIRLGKDPAAAQTKLDFLNQIFKTEANWQNPPDTIPADIRDLWRGGKSIGDESGSAELQALRAGSQSDHWRSECQRLEAENKKLLRELEKYRGKTREGPCPSLQTALDAWIMRYAGRDADWTTIVHNDLKRFVAHFGPDLECDDLAGRERDIGDWLRGLQVSWGKRKGESLSAGRRDQMRKIIARFLKDSGVAIDREALPTVSKKEVRNGRGAIRWLERHQAEAVAKALPLPWRDYFLVHVALGVRPDELLTLHRSNFHGDDFERVTLAPLGALTLKQGSRTIQVPESVRPILVRRFSRANEVLFAEPETGKPWRDPKRFNRFYHKALDKAGAAAGVAMKMDCRIPRRTCASLLLRGGVRIEHVAATLGDDPKTIREHYASILPHETDMSAAVLALNLPAKKTPARKAVKAKQVETRRAKIDSI